MGLGKLFLDGDFVRKVGDFNRERLDCSLLLLVQIELHIVLCTEAV